MLKPRAAGTPGSKPVVERPAVVASPYRDVPYLVFAAMIMLWAVAFMQFFSVIPVYFKEHFLLNEGQIGALLALNGLLIALFEMPFVYSLEGRFSQIGLIRWGIIAVAVSYLLFLAPTHWVLLAVVAVIVITLGEMLAMPFASSFSMNRSNDFNRGQYMAVYSLSYSVAHVAAPLIGLNVADHFGYGALWILLAGLCGLSYAGMLWLSKRV